METEYSNIVLFDGVCNLCNGGVQFIIKRDKKNIFKFAALQSEFGQAQLVKYKLDTSSFDSFILIKNEAIFQKSTAALKIAKELKSGWQFFYVFIIIPAFIRDWLYDRVAKNRYRMFGKKDSCMIPTPELKAKFLG
ncbi:MAG: thiol-disulfide oxidoreductase DCC family protein [Bacteroidales bacterium]|nr:thiol-disulfide oxidoreductase DCC family protein [Bacteroidales bacterium]